MEIKLVLKFVLFVWTFCLGVALTGFGWVLGFCAGSVKWLVITWSWPQGSFLAWMSDEVVLCNRTRVGGRVAPWKLERCSQATVRCIHNISNAVILGKNLKFLFETAQELTCCSWIDSLSLFRIWVIYAREWPEQGKHLTGGGGHREGRNSGGETRNHSRFPNAKRGQRIWDQPDKLCVNFCQQKTSCQDSSLQRQVCSAVMLAFFCPFAFVVRQKAVKNPRYDRHEPRRREQDTNFVLKLLLVFVMQLMSGKDL